MGMGHIVEKEKLMFVHHLRHLDEKTQAHQVHTERVAHNWPGLAAEASIICLRLKLEDFNITDCSKTQYTDWINKAMRRADEKHLRSNMEGRTKVKDLVTEDCRMKKYFEEKSLAITREILRIRTKMNQLQRNFKNYSKLNTDGSMCVACGIHVD